MKIGINLVGISYNDGSNGSRYRNYEESVSSFFRYIVNPLLEKGHDIKFYLFSYDNIKKNDIIKVYNPTKSNFVNECYNTLGGGDIISDGFKMMSISYINSLEQMIGEDLDLVISTRYDINFYKNPFEEYQYDFNKCNFLWREPLHTDLPIVNDTFIVFPYNMIQNVINAIVYMETNPPYNVNIGMHNFYLPMIKEVGPENVQWLDNEFVKGIPNKLYNLTRHG